ncbi:hypothetical protein CR513_08666, partial [Mucuna pruriens]
SVCTQPRSSRIVSVEVDSAQSLLRATRPLPRRVEYQSSHSRFILSLSFLPIGSERCFSKVSRRSRRYRSRVWEARGYQRRLLNIVDCMTRSSYNILYELDLEIDRTLCRLRKVGSSIVSNNSSSNINSNFNFGLNKSQESEQMESNDRTLKELAMLDVVKPPQALKGISRGLFHDKATRDTERLHQEEVLVLFSTWGDMKHMFLEKFFQASRTVTIKKEINIRERSCILGKIYLPMCHMSTSSDK